ncbi:MAG: tRNA 5-methoxyuridine(34)/uridine 5-oxyacetic acid(34) synthase CmoB [Bryobacterales bacterium]|jgi:tRNA (mo5U34)-methyltransferase|nr:tRNA 5-methoxyuridine(34)/uridine 5-oxyacetic acid(34) synthase CmoB [Bryobacterales bacterium]
MSARSFTIESPDARPGAPPGTVSAGGNNATRTLEARVREFPFWYHRIPLPGGVVTPGWAPIDAASYQIPARLDGKRVLDVGAWDGYWTFEALRRGAREVVAIDDFSDYLGSLKEEDRKAWQTFDLCRDALGYTEPQCQRRELSIYEISREALGEFDVVFAFGLLYHLRYPLLALDLMSKVCTGELYVESAILDDFSPYRGGLHHGYMGGQMVMEFYPDNQYGNNHTNWWAPTLHCLAHMVRAAGFDDINGWKLRAQPGSLAECRGFVKGVKAANPSR